LILWHAYHIFPTTCWVPTISVLNLAIFPMLLKPTAQNLKKIWDFLWGVIGERFPLVDCLWSYRVFSLLYLWEFSIYSYVRHYSCNKYFILRHWLFCIHSSVWYVCKLDSWAHILWAFGFDLKTGCDNFNIVLVNTILHVTICTKCCNLETSSP
jgi:hypothetical protein